MNIIVIYAKIGVYMFETAGDELKLLVLSDEKIKSVKTLSGYNLSFTETAVEIVITVPDAQREHPFTFSN